MRIGIDASRYGSAEATGVENYSRSIIDGLVKCKAKKDGITFYTREPMQIEGGDVKVVESKRLWTLVGLSREMWKNPPDVLFVPSHVLPLALPERSVITIHDVAFKRLRSAYSMKEYRYLDWSTGWAVKKASKIIVPSQATKDDLVTFYECNKRKIKVIPHGFSALKISKEDQETVKKYSEIFKYFNLDDKKPTILFVGRLEDKKNLVRLVEAFGRFAQERPEWRLILAGKRGRGFLKISDKVRKLGLVKQVLMPGYVSEGEKAVLMGMCDIFAFPSLYEGFGLPILEAFHYEKPVLASGVASIPEVAGDAALTVNPRSAEAIAVGLGKLADDRGLRERLVAAGKERLKEFSWEKAAKATWDVLKG